MVGLGGHDDAVRPEHVPRPPHRLVGGVARMVYVHVLARHAQFDTVRLHGVGLVVMGGAVVAADDDGPGRTSLVQVAGHFQAISQNIARRAVGVHAGPQHHHGIGRVAGAAPSTVTTRSRVVATVTTLATPTMSTASAQTASSTRAHQRHQGTGRALSRATGHLLHSIGKAGYTIAKIQTCPVVREVIPDKVGILHKLRNRFLVVTATTR